MSVLSRRRQGSQLAARPRPLTWIPSLTLAGRNEATASGKVESRQTEERTSPAPILGRPASSTTTIDAPRRSCRLLNTVAPPSPDWSQPSTTLYVTGQNRREPTFSCSKVRDSDHDCCHSPLPTFHHASRTFSPAFGRAARLRVCLCRYCRQCLLLLPSQGWALLGGGRQRLGENI